MKKPTPDPVAQILSRAAEVLGSRDKAELWIGRPVRGLNFQTPMSFIRAGETKRVERLLWQMECGIW